MIYIYREGNLRFLDKESYFFKKSNNSCYLPKMKFSYQKREANISKKLLQT